MRHRPTPQWMRNGLRAVFNHEPVFFLQRRGGWFVDAQDVRDVSYGEESVRKLADAGIDMYVVHGYKGFGLEFEKKEHDRLRRLRDFCTKHGVRLGTYCQVATLCLETMLPDYPDCRNWTQRDARGRVPTYSYQTYRKRPCLNNTGFREYYKSVVRYLIKEIGTDLLHFDNLIETPEPRSCHCEHCRAGFASRLQEKYPDPDRAEARFGHTNLHLIEPPAWHPEIDPIGWSEIVDPGFQDWEEFRNLTVKRFIEEMAELAVSLNPEVGIEANIGSVPEMNRYRHSGTYYPFIAQHVDIIYNESSGRMPRINDNGALGTNIVGYKMGRALGSGIWGGGNYDDPVAVEKTIAERLAFSPDYYFSPYCFDVYSDVYARYNAFHEAHHSCYHGVDHVRDVAVLFSYHTQQRDALADHMAELTAVQTLLFAGIPFGIVFDEDLGRLDDVKVLFLPNATCLSDVQCERIMTWVRAGGGLVMTGPTAMRNEWSLLRDASGLAALFGKTPERSSRVCPSSGDGAYVRLGRSAGSTARSPFGEGRAVHLPSIVPDPLPEMPGKVIRQEHWRVPENSEEIVESVLWACNNDLTARLHGPKYCVAEFTRVPETGRRVVHVVNFSRGDCREDVRLELQSPPPELLFREPGKAEQAVRLCDDGTYYLPAFRHYCLVVEP